MANETGIKNYEKKKTSEFDIYRIIAQKSVVSFIFLAVFFSVSKRTILRNLSPQIKRSLNYRGSGLSTHRLIQKKADSNGIWYNGKYVFSIFRGIKRTLTRLINQSREGYTESEIKNILKMRTYRHLRGLCKVGLLNYVKIGHTYIYLSPDIEKAKRQLIRRYSHHKGFQLRLKGKFQKIMYQDTGERLKEYIRKATLKRGIELDDREIDIALASLLRPLLRGGKSDGDFAIFLKRVPQLNGFFSFLRSFSPHRSEINEVKQQFNSYILMEIFHMMIVWIVKELNLKNITVVVDGSHGYQSMGNKRGIKIHAACIAELGLPIGLNLMEDGMAYDLKTLCALLQQIRDLGVEVDFVIGDGLYNAPEFYYVVNDILGAEGIAHWIWDEKSEKWPEHKNIVEYLKALVTARKDVIEHNQRKHKGRNKKVPKASISFRDDPNIIGKLLKLYPLTLWGSEKRREVYRKRPVIERLFSILKSWLDLDGMRTKKHARMWNVFSSFISLLTVSMLSMSLGIPSLLLCVRKLAL